MKVPLKCAGMHIEKYSTIWGFGLYGQLSDDMVLIAALLVRVEGNRITPDGIHTSAGVGKIHASRRSIMFATMLVMCPANVQQAPSPTVPSELRDRE